MGIQDVRYVMGQQGARIQDLSDVRVLGTGDMILYHRYYRPVYAVYIGYGHMHTLLELLVSYRTGINWIA